MAVIQEDVVSISFDVQNNPLQDIARQANEMQRSVTSGINGAESSLRQLANASSTASDSVGDIADTARQINGSGADSLRSTIQQTNQTAQGTNRTFTEMVGHVRDIARTRIGNGFNTLREIPRQAQSQFTRLRTTISSVRSMNFRTLGHSLNVGVGNALTAASRGARVLWNGLRNVARVSMNAVVSGVKKLASGMQSAIKCAGKLAVSVGNGVKKMAKGITAGIGAMSVAVGGLTAKAVSSYADYEQLVGGVETLFKDSAPKVQQYANEAFESCGISANKYMETATSFSASLISSVGGDTAAAADLANQAMIDMSDNANKMGTDMDYIMQTYQSLAKGNYAMLDNLKLGYGGTKTEMERLIKDAAKLDSSIDANSMSFGNVVKAIHAVQDNLGITGTTSKEASETISGSLNAMKAAWSNVLPALVQGGDAFDTTVDNLVKKVKVFAKNVMPAVKSALGGVANLISELAPIIAKQLPKLVKQLVKPLVSAATSIVQGIVKTVPELLGSIIDLLPSVLPALLDCVVTLIDGLITTVSQNTSKIVSVVTTMIPKIIQAIVTLLPQLVITGIQLLLALAQGIAQQLPTLIPMVMQGINNLINGIVSMLPQIIQTGMQILIALVIGIGQQLPTLIPTAINAIMTLVNSLISMLPTLIQVGLQLIVYLVQGIVASLPQLIPAGIQAIISLINGIVQAIPMIIQTVIQLIPIIVQTLIQNLPLLIQGGIQCIIALAVGLIQAIPQLIAAIPQIVASFIDALFSTDWIQVGKDLISGVWNGIKSLFGGGDEAGKGASESVANGIDSNKYMVDAAGQNLANSAATNMQIDTVQVSSYGASSGVSMASGINSSVSSANIAAMNLANTTATSMALPDTSQYGTMAATNLASGITASTGTATSAAASMSSQVSSAAATDVDVKINADTESMNTFNAKVKQLVNESSGALKKLPSAFKTNLNACKNTVTTQANAMLQAWNKGMQTLSTNTTSAMTSIRNIIQSTNLYGAGVYAMQGLNNGMSSMKGTLISTARSIATAVSDTINKSLDIHSPSRVTEKSGQYTAQGLINGMSGYKDKVTKAASDLSTSVDTSINPYVSKYTPSNSSTTTNTSNQTNNFNPQFTLNMNGASATETNKRKVKRWIKESIAETFESMGRISPELVEV